LTLQKTRGGDRRLLAVWRVLDPRGSIIESNTVHSSDPLDSCQPSQPEVPMRRLGLAGVLALDIIETGAP